MLSFLDATVCKLTQYLQMLTNMDSGGHCLRPQFGPRMRDSEAGLVMEVGEHTPRDYPSHVVGS